MADFGGGGFGRGFRRGGGRGFGGRGRGRGRGFGSRGRGRGPRGRGSRGGGRGGKDEWIPATKLCRLVQDGRFPELSDIYLYSIRIKEPEIVDHYFSLVSKQKYSNN